MLPAGWLGSVFVGGLFVRGWRRIETFGDAGEVRERQVRLFLPEYMGVGAQRQLRVCMAKLLGHPTQALPRSQRQAGVGVACGVELQGPNPRLLRPSPDPVPGALYVPFLKGRASQGAEDPLGNLPPAPLESFLAARGE